MTKHGKKYTAAAAKVDIDKVYSAREAVALAKETSITKFDATVEVHVRTNISGCTNSCGQHHIANIGFFGAERRAHGRSAPGYQMLLGGHVGDEKIEFGAKALRLPAQAALTSLPMTMRR